MLTKWDKFFKNKKNSNKSTCSVPYCNPKDGPFFSRIICALDSAWCYKSMYLK